MTDRKETTDAEIEVEGKRIAAWWQSLTPEQQEANQQKLLDMVFGEGTLTVPPKDVS